MSDSLRFVHILDDTPGVPRRGDPAYPPPLVVALEGFLDAGNAGRLAVEHLRSGGAEEPPGHGQVVASFEIDAFYDYRARRPAMLFVEDHYEGYTAPTLVVRSMRDAGGTPYLLLHGPEPDTHWEQFAASVRAIVEHFGVELTISLGSVPMAVPHTRPVMVTNHATRRELLVSENIWQGSIQIPSSAMAMLEQRLGEWGRDGMGFVAHVPHYVAQVDYPAAAASLLESLQGVSGLRWDLEALRAGAVSREAEIAEQVADSAEVTEVVAGLERQYDSLRRSAPGASGLSEERDLPTAEELGAEFERFLARLDDEND